MQSILGTSGPRLVFQKRMGESECIVRTQNTISLKVFCICADGFVEGPEVNILWG